METDFFEQIIRKAYPSATYGAFVSVEKKGQQLVACINHCGSDVTLNHQINKHGKWIDELKRKYPDLKEVMCWEVSGEFPGFEMGFVDSLDVFWNIHYNLEHGTLETHIYREGGYLDEQDVRSLNPVVNLAEIYHLGEQWILQESSYRLKWVTGRIENLGCKALR